ncbi:MAG: LytTR family transcriptional regulator [Firmicutes bacterium]|nr:LytTR family transcriptional regulator [Bacillota bacterium]
MPIRSGRQTVFVNPHSILYVQSQRNRTELVCVDRVISCNIPIGKLAKQLPETFYPLHRDYLVNTLYVLAIRRFEAELISGICIPIPVLTYQQAKQDLQKLIKGE